MEKNKIIKSCIILLIFIIFALIIAIFALENSTQKIETINQDVNTILTPSNTLIEIKSISEYKNISNCVNKYLKYISDKNDEAIYDLLIANYTENEKITMNNLINKMDNINYDAEFIVKKVYSFEANLGLKTYFVNGYILNKDEKSKKEYNIVLNIDYSSETFEIAPLQDTYTDYIDCSDFDNIVIKNEKIKDEIKEIEKSEFNNVEVVNGLRRKTNYGILFQTIYFKYGI